MSPNHTKDPRQHCGRLKKRNGGHAASAPGGAPFLLESGSELDKLNLPVIRPVGAEMGVTCILQINAPPLGGSSGTFSQSFLC